MKRRSFVSAAAASLAAGAGCLGSDGDLARLAWLDLRNHRQREYEVEVVVEEDGDLVFSDTYRLGTEPDTANAVEENPVEGEGNYLVRATMDGEQREVDATTFVDGEEPCVGVTFELLDNGSVDYSTKSMREC